MSKFIDSLRDIIYDSIDYIIILGIILVVGLVISWRLDILFKRDVDTNTASIESNVEKDKPANEDTETVENPETSNESNPTKTEEPATSEVKKENNEPTNTAVANTGETKNISIPSGANSTDIGNILADNGLVSSSSEFNTKSEEMGLSTKLKSGNFSIPVGTPLEEVLRIITK